MFTIRFRKKKKSDIPPPCTCGKNCDRGRERAGTFCVLGTILIDIVRDTEESTMEIKKMLLLPVDHFDESTDTELPLMPSEKFSTCKCIEGGWSRKHVIEVFGTFLPTAYVCPETDPAGVNLFLPEETHA